MKTIVLIVFISVPISGCALLPEKQTHPVDPNAPVGYVESEDTGPPYHKPRRPDVEMALSSTNKIHPPGVNPYPEPQGFVEGGSE